MAFGGPALVYVLPSCSVLLLLFVLNAGVEFAAVTGGDPERLRLFAVRV